MPTAPETAPLIVASVTKLGPEARGRVIVTGSHGGAYAAYLAARSGCRAALFNDAGVGLQEAGIAGLILCEELGMAAAAVDHMTARIGDAQDAARRGRISHANATAVVLGLRPGMPCLEAAALLATAPEPTRTPPTRREARQVIPAETPEGRALALIDSASLVRPEDAGQIVVTGSHGGLVGGDPRLALQVDAFAALFNDAGVGLEEAGITRLPALDDRGIAAATVQADTARIGDAQSTWRDGRLSHCNSAALAHGARPGMRAQDWVERLRTITP